MPTYKTPLQPYDPIIPKRGSRAFQYIVSDFMQAGQNSFATPLTENQQLFRALTNVMPVATGAIKLRYGYTFLNNPAVGTISRLYSYQNQTSAIRKLVYVSILGGVNISNEDGTGLSNIFTSSFATAPRLVNSRDYLYMPFTLSPQTWPSGQQSDGEKWHSTQGLSNWGIPRPPGTIGVTSTAAAGNITLVSTIGRVYAGAYLNSSTGHYGDTDTSLGSFTSGSGGPSTPGTESQDASGIIAWSNLGNIAAEDGVVTSAVLTSGSTTNVLAATNYGFAVPGTATITGIQVTLKKDTTQGLIQDLSVRLVKGGTVSGDEKADTVTNWNNIPTLTNSFYGGSSDTWGLTLTPTDVNAANFGVAFSAQNTGIPSGTAQVDVVKITVFYATGTGVKTGAIAGKQVALSLPTSNPPTGVDKFVILATLDGGDTTTLYVLDTVPITATTYTDNTPDTVLVTNNIASEVDEFGINHGLINNKFPPLKMLFPTKHRGRLFGLVGSNLYFSKSLDEVTTSTGLVAGRHEEAWPAANFIPISTQQETGRGLLSDGTTLYIGTERHIWKLDGDSPLNFSKPEVIFNEVGIFNQDVWQICFAEGQPVGMIWLTPDFRVIMSNFATYQDIGTPIQDIFNSLNITAGNPAWGQFFSQQSYDVFVMAIPTGVFNNTPDTLCVYDLRGGRWYVWKPTDTMTAGLLNVTATGTTQWVVAVQDGRIYNFNPSATQDRVGNTPVPITATITTPWLHFGKPTDRKAWNMLEVITADPNMLVTINGASLNSQTGSPNVVVSNASLASSQFGYLKLYLAGKQARDKHYQITFTSSGGVQDVLLGFTAELLPFEGF